MTHFVVYLLDKTGMGELREKVRPLHLEFIKNLGSQVKAGGPLLADDGETKVGGMYILEASDLASARKTAERDPYFTSGLAESMDVRMWRWQTDNR